VTPRSRKFRTTPASTAFLQALRDQVHLVEPDALPSPVCRDPDDDVVLATAVAARATTIVTGDDDLLVSKQYAGIAIVSARQFLERLDAA
jgi:putative PIN family toxin of toxin-antitoxin system